MCDVNYFFKLRRPVCLFKYCIIKFLILDVTMGCLVATLVLLSDIIFSALTLITKNEITRHHLKLIFTPPPSPPPSVPTGDGCV